MAGTGRSLTPRGRFAVRAAILAVFALVAGVISGVAGYLGETESSTSSPEVVTTRTPESAPNTGDKGKTGNKSGKSKNGDEPGRVPAGVTSGIGDDVRIGSLDLLAAQSFVGTPDVAALDRIPAASGLRVFSWPGEGALVWNGHRFTELASGNEYGTRSILGADGLEPRRILWVTVRDADTGLRISFVKASLETGDDPATEAANAAYSQRVRELTDRLSRTSSVVLSTSVGASHRVSVPAGNVHPGEVVAMRGRHAVSGGSSARIALQASDH